MTRHTTHLTLLIAVSLLSSYSSEGAGSPALVAPGGVWWQPRNVLSVQKAIELNGDSRLEADEIRILAPIVTQGHSLSLFGRRVVFGPEGKIVAFSRSAPQGIGGPNFGAAAKQGARQQVGENGSTGKLGNNGQHGLGADGRHLPGEIAVFAAEFNGTPQILANGQDGGKGGAGGTGQSGGEGGIGSRAEAKDPCFFGSDKAAGAGSEGGEFGKGGHGGDGGNGGTPTPSRLLTTLTPQTFALGNTITGNPGVGGDGGDAGKPGDAGAGGPGGEGDSNSCWVPFLGSIRNTLPQGASGPKGKGCLCTADTPNCVCKPDDKECILSKCTEGNGTEGVAGPNVELETIQSLLHRDRLQVAKAFDTFENARFAVTLDWFEFHWWRLLELMLHRSIQLLDDMAAEGEVSGEDAILAQKVRGEILLQVRRQWKSHFIEFAEKNLASEAVDARAKARLEKALSQAKTFDQVLGRIRSEKGVEPAVAHALAGVLETSKTARKEALQAAASGCGKYVHDVLQSELFQTWLRDAQYHFSIPACEQAADFSADTVSSFRPIELVPDVQLLVSNNLRTAPAEAVPVDAIKTEELGGVTEDQATLWQLLNPILWAEQLFNWVLPEAMAKDVDLSVIILSPRKIKPDTLRLGAFDKTVSVRFSELGLHKGFLNPEEKRTDLKSLATELRALAGLGMKP